MSARLAGFSPQWLSRRLAALIPEYPRCAVCLAFSGGLDSLALLAALAAARPPPRHLRAVHVDHHLHPRSTDWRRHCRRVAHALGVPFKALDAQVPRGRGLSLEAEARRARYALLERELAPGEILLTAHHLDDQAETLLLQLLRGAGLAGLAAMPERARFGRGWLVRPLLERPRSELAAWVQARGLAWVEDETNADERFDRNYLRLRVRPLLEARWPAALQAIARTARLAAEAQQLLERLAERDVERACDGEALAVPDLRALSPERRRNLLRYWLRLRTGSVPDAKHLAILAGPLLETRSDATPCVSWPGGEVRRHGQRLLAARPRGAPAARRDAAAPAPIEWVWRRRPELELPGGAGRLRLAPDPHGEVDLARLPQRLEVRFRRGGERLALAAGGGHRSLKELLREARLPPWRRGRVPLVCAGGALLAVGDLFVAAAVRAGRDARRRGRIVWTPEEPTC